MRRNKVGFLNDHIWSSGLGRSHQRLRYTNTNLWTAASYRLGFYGPAKPKLPLWVLYWAIDLNFDNAEGGFCAAAGGGLGVGCTWDFNDVTERVAITYAARQLDLQVAAGHRRERESHVT